MNRSKHDWRYIIECEKQNRSEAWDRHQARKVRRFIVAVFFLAASAAGLAILIGGGLQ